jgi:hypothetical protein
MRKIEPEADGVLKDGQLVSFRMTMMDGMPAPITDGAAVFDHHKPHSAVLTNDQRNAAIERQAAYDKRISDAWRDPPVAYIPQDLSRTPPEVTKPVAFGEGKPLKADHIGLDQLQAANERRYAARISEAWRNPTNQGAQ